MVNTDEQASAGATKREEPATPDIKVVIPDESDEEGLRKLNIDFTKENNNNS